jgi:stage V sporulation protein B
LMPTTASSTPVAANSRTARVSRLTLLFAVSTGIIFALLAAPMTVLLGPRFGGALVLVWILLPGSTLFSLAKVLAADLTGRGHPELCTYCSGGAFVLSVTLDLLLIPHYGVAAAAGISSLIYSLQTLYFLHCCHSVTSLSYHSLLVPTVSDIKQSVAAIASHWARIRNTRQVAMVSHLS